MSIEALIDADVLVDKLQTKADELPAKLKELVGAVTFAVDEEVKRERPDGPMPVITGNLQGSISIDNISDYSKRIYPDEGIAPYAIYVMRGVRGKGRVAPIDFMGDGYTAAEPRADALVDEFMDWLKE